jgi:predicted transcriptional regulator
MIRAKGRFLTMPQGNSQSVDEEKARRMAQLDASIARGIADADAGRVHPADEVFSELRQRIRQKAQTRGSAIS